MKLFSALYETMISLSKRKQAPYFLAGISFAESSFFPIPPDIMLISMGLGRPKSVWMYAFITTFFSVIGGVFGYFIGVYALDFFLPMIKSVGYFDRYLMVKQAFEAYGIAFIFIAGFTPIPYKLFTIAAGAMNMALLPFVFASFIGRGMRFFLVAALLFYKGEAIEKQLSKHVERLSWCIVAGLLIIYCMVKLFST
tara:strand:+ start:2785 stop:3372 length:588 start_codon:yes stop_codon:yes gene_type:complete